MCPDPVRVSLGQPPCAADRDIGPSSTSGSPPLPTVGGPPPGRGQPERSAGRSRWHGRDRLYGHPQGREFTRQYSGTLGRIVNCQEGSFLVYADFHNHTLLDWELYLLEVWITSQLRPCKVGCSPDTPYSPRPELVRHMLEQVLYAGAPVAWVMGTRSMVTPVTCVAGRRRRLPCCDEVCRHRLPMELQGKIPTGQTWRRIDGTWTHAAVAVWG